MSIQAFLYSRRAEEASWRHNDLLLFSSLIMTQTKSHCPSTRPLIKPNTLYHPLITSTQQPESEQASVFWMRGVEQSSGRTGSGGKHPVYRSGAVHCLMAQGGNYILLLHHPNTQTQRLLYQSKGGKKHTQCKTFLSNNQSFWYAHLLGSWFCRCYTCTISHTHSHTHLQVWYSSRDIGKLVILVLIGIEIPPFFSSQQPLQGNADWFSSESW